MCMFASTIAPVQLKAKKNELDEKSEELGAVFVEGKMELAQFLTVSASQWSAGCG